ncbi:pyridoxamine 5'-phosphate oxidase family protein [Bacillus sp. FJAT-22090]|uniref:pyridoxamine 5'-phosphate oxidase family protein n=1 Tax=Bacillus sp. FJAT-22090 TaxID=1581038 RepID=UPI0011A0910D|nr:pyridoxamine 5'-phosphate oxidase family protein [Bacillus sp. FJAT-22090]
MAKDAKELAKKILKESLTGTMATIEQNKPHSRYMTFFNEDFILYTATNKKTHKVEEIKKNPTTHILLGYEGNGLGDTFLEIEGTVEESVDEGIKKKVWNNALKGWFDGPEDPSLVILKITPIQIRVMNTKGEEPQIVEF